MDIEELAPHWATHTAVARPESGRRRPAWIGSKYYQYHGGMQSDIVFVLGDAGALNRWEFVDFTPIQGRSSEYTGGSVSYYTVRVLEPTDPAHDQYDAECNDIIEALQMNYAEGNAFKALWRRAAARLGKQKRGYDGGLYDAEKVEFFGARLVEQSKQERGND